MNRYNEGDLPKGSFYGLVKDQIAVDLFKPKFGDEKDFVVFSFFMKQRDVASKLMNYMVQKNFDLLDIEVSPDPKEDGKYILFIEMNRNKDMFATMDKLLLHIDHLVSVKQWHFRTPAYSEYMDWNRSNFFKIVPQTPGEYSSKGPIPAGHDEIDHAVQNLQDTNINHQLLEKIIEKQIAKLSQSYIKSLKEQIKSINENKLRMSRHIEDLKIDREHLYKQLEMYHDREKMALIREQQDFKRIKSLENQLNLLAPPDSREMKIVTPEKNTYDTDAKVDHGKEIYTEVRDDYKEAPEQDPHPDKASALNETSDSDVLSDLHDETHFQDSSGFVNKEHRDYPDGDEGIEKPTKHPAYEPLINTEKEKTEKTGKEKVHRTAEPFVPAKEGEVRKAETSVDLQEIEHTESADKDVAVRLDDIISQGLLEESHAKVDDESAPGDDPVPEYMARGMEALKKKDYDDAIDCFLKVVAIIPTAGTVVLNLADLYFLKKEYATARKYADQALKLGEESASLVLDKIGEVLAPDASLPSSEKATEKIGKEVTARTKDSEEVTLESDDYYKPHAKAVEQEPEQEETASELYDTVFIEQAALNEAINPTGHAKDASAEDAVWEDDDEKIEPKKEDARKQMALGVNAAGQKDYHKAVEHFNKVVEILPDSAAGFCNLAVLNYRLKEYETAYRHAKKAIDLGSPSAKRILEKIKPVMVAELKSSTGFKPAAEVEKIKYSQVVKKDEGEDFFIDSDDVSLDEFLKIKKQDQSDLAVAASLREKDAVVNDTFKLGLAAFEKKEFREAIGHFNKVVELLPNGVPSYIHLTKIHYHLGEYSQARKYAKKAFGLGDYTLIPILKKMDAKLAKKPASLPSTGSVELKKQETPAEAIDGIEEEPEVPESHTDTVPDKKKVEGESKPKAGAKMTEVEAAESPVLDEAADSTDQVQTASVEDDVFQGDNEKSDPHDDAKKYMAFGVEATAQKDYNQAVKHFSKAVEILPDNAVGFYNLANLHYHLGNYQTARENAEKASHLGLNPAQSMLEKIKTKMTAVPTSLADKRKEKPPVKKVSIETGKAESGRKIIVQAELPKEESAEKMTHGKSGLKPPQGLAEPAGIRQPASGNGSAAETISHDTSNQAESSQGIYGSASENFKLGLAASERNEYDIALEYFNKVAMALPKVPSSFLNMADLHYRMKNYQTARKHAERALELGANSAHRILSKIEESLAEKKKEEPEPAFDS